jgi:hypothetical protein
VGFDHMETAEKMTSQRGPVAAGVANRDLAQIILSPRVGGTNSPLNPASRRSLSTRRLQEPDPYAVFNFFKTPPDPRDSSPGLSPLSGGSESVSSANLTSDGKKTHSSSRKGNIVAVGYDVCNCIAESSIKVTRLVSGRRRQGLQQCLFFLSALLIFTFLVVKIMSGGLLHGNNNNIQLSSSLQKV